jgi:hypothetical protein
MQTDISLRFWPYRRKGVSAWEFEPELRLPIVSSRPGRRLSFSIPSAACRVTCPFRSRMRSITGRRRSTTKPESTLISIGLTTKPYPLFRLPGDVYITVIRLLTVIDVLLGWHKSSVAYTSTGYRRFNQPFAATNYGPQYVQGDVIGVGYRPRVGTVFFTRNGKARRRGARAQDAKLLPHRRRQRPCTVHVNFGQMGFVFIEANVKKWGLAPMTGSLAPPPPYGSEQGSILLEAGREGAPNTQGAGGGGYFVASHSRSRSANFPSRAGPPTSPGLVRSPTDISLAQLAHIPHEDLGEERAVPGGRNGRVIRIRRDSTAHMRPRTTTNTRILRPTTRVRRLRPQAVGGVAARRMMMTTMMVVSRGRCYDLARPPIPLMMLRLGIYRAGIRIHSVVSLSRWRLFGS